ncbi:MAG: hypothetical protein OXE59_06220 [Bacteroidetes bacterium]|nr:hypothetical protein [Bacteroidota bacterium]
MMKRLVCIIILALQGYVAIGQDAPRPTETVKLLVPKLAVAPEIDGDLAEWKDLAFTDGVWDIYRLRHTFWYDDGRRNRLTDHGNEPHPEDDLQARYYVAWDSEYLYFGAEVKDNVNDVEAPGDEPFAWYLRDSICFFLEAPRDEAPEYWGQGDNAFCFVADASKPDYAAWWRHGTASEQRIEEPIPEEAVSYEFRFNPWGVSVADYILEARVKLMPTFGKSDPRWTPPQVGDVYGFEIVHCDPDGGPYGGHFMIYGTGDDDATWGRMILTGTQMPMERRAE